LRVEEWRLEDGGGEAESVLQWEIDSIDGLGSHGPFLAVNRSAQPRDFTVIPKQAAAPDVAKDVIRLHFVGRVVSPRFRIAYTHIQSVELRLGFRFGRRIHPRERFNALPERGDDVANHRLYLGLGLGREKALRVDLSHLVA